MKNLILIILVLYTCGALALECHSTSNSNWVKAFTENVAGCEYSPFVSDNEAYKHHNAYFDKNDFQLGYPLTKSLGIPDTTIDNKDIQPDYFIYTDKPKHHWFGFTYRILNELSRC